MRRNLLRWFIMMVVLMLVFGSQAAAFRDLTAGDEADEKIKKLQEMGILNGVNGEFQGDRDITYAEGIHMLVKGMGLSLDGIAFIKKPEARDSYDYVPEDAWYTESFIIASVLGLELPRDIDPQAVMTREAYAHHLMTALTLTGNYPFTKMYYIIQDEADLNPDYVHSIQLLLNGRIITLDEEGRFHPKQVITRKDAAVMLYDAIEFKNRYPQPILERDDKDGEVSFEVVPVSEEVNKVTVSWGEQPHPGYGIRIVTIEFVEEYQTAVIYYELSYPDPELMYPQVIVYPEDHTYVSSEYEVIIVEKKE